MIKRKHTTRERSFWTTHGKFMPGHTPRTIPTKYGPPAGCHIRTTVGAKPIADILAAQLPESTQELLELIEGREWIDVLLAGKRLVSNGWDVSVTKDVLVTADSLYRAIIATTNDILPTAKVPWKHERPRPADSVTPEGPEGEPGDLMASELEVSSEPVEGPSE